MTSTAPPQAWSSARSEHQGERRSRWPFDTLLVAVVSAVAIGLRVGALGPSSLWLDDAWVALVARTETLTELRYVGFSAPGFAVLLRVWFEIVGFSETTAQALPFAAGVVAPGLAYLVGRQVGWHRAAALAPALVLTFAPMAVDYATRVKQYTTEMVLALGLIALAVHLLGEVRSPRRWVVFVGAAAFATTISAFLAPYAAAGVAAGMVHALRDHDRVALRYGSVAALGYGIFGGFWYLAVLAPAVTHSIRSFWSGHYLVMTGGAAPAIDSLRVAGAGVAGGLSGLPVVLTGLALLTAVVVVATRRSELAVLLVTPLLVAVVLAVVQVAPLGGGRTDLYLYPGLALLFGGALDAVIRTVPSGAGSPVGWAATGLLGVGLVLSAEPVAPYPDQDVRPLVTQLEMRRAPDDAVLLYPATIWAYALYTPGAISLERDDASSWGFAPRFADAATFPLPPGRDDPGAYAATVSTLAGRADTIWLLASHWRDDFDALEEQLRSAGFERVDLERRPGARLARWVQR